MGKNNNRKILKKCYDSYRFVQIRIFEGPTSYNSYLIIFVSNNFNYK